ncbi:histidine kinase dimerization/phosphoacceptor domain-containing protein [Arthrobacter sp. SRS-W-1-2016]|uniref:histidine kinase n=1 Tax=Arthrobacter sp. SRS-W-1-2016 TaxID=1930254 RepID=UPI000990E055|nr:histidine kinase dimerization/phosphoacceptor domain-containing protein [Arthrobacter sp. SRS-W-1-2016]
MRSSMVPGHGGDEETPRRAAWLGACLDVSSHFARNDPQARTGGLDFIAGQACRGSGCRQALILVPTRTEGTFLVAGAAGADKADATGQIVHLDPAVGDLHSATAGQALLTDGAGLSGQLPGPDTGDILAITLQAERVEHGLLVLRGAKAPGFTRTDLQMGAYFGSHAALALQLQDTQMTREEDLVYLDRDRIARDLHDVVIQRLFAAGLGIQTLPNIADHQEAVRRVRAITTELDESIRQLRETIYALHPYRSNEPNSAARLPATRRPVPEPDPATDIPGSVD